VLRRLRSSNSASSSLTTTPPMPPRRQPPALARSEATSPEQWQSAVQSALFEINSRASYDKVVGRLL
jgi:hypothetical protein